MANEKTRGFVTIATGHDRYYTLALNLLNSYRLNSKDPLPFAIISDRENDITKAFDKVVITPTPHNSYMDKILIGKYLPFDETIFIDADCLAYSDLNVLFDIFGEADDFCCLGRTLPLTEQTDGWFSLSSFPESDGGNPDIIDRETASKTLSYAVGMHGGMYYVRNSEPSQRVFQDALKIADTYSSYKFCLFEKPADEPILALAMAMNNCKPIPFESFGITCFWIDSNVKLNMYKGIAKKKDGTEIPLMHWGNYNTKAPVYKKQVDQMNMRINGVKGPMVFFSNLGNSVRMFGYSLRKSYYSLKTIVYRILKGSK
ncbi:MAG: hypothetical protein IKY44_06570 [Clostridia bacterium]|nr:hypothetical protein [Clostridia bacterium]